MGSTPISLTLLLSKPYNTSIPNIHYLTIFNMKKLLVILIVLILALIPFVSFSQQGSGEHPQLGEFTATLIDKSVRVEYGSNLIILTNHVTTRENRYLDYVGGVPELITIHIIYYCGELVATIVGGDATLISTPWLLLEPVKASND